MAKEEETNTARKSIGATKQLTGAMARNVPALQLLTASLGKLHIVQGTLSKSLINTGQTQLNSITQLGKTVDNAGLGLAESVELNAEVLDRGLATYGANTKALNDAGSAFSKTKTVLSQFKNLGRDTKAMTKVLGVNSQMLGLSLDASLELAEQSQKLGEAYGFSGDKLIKAIEQLEKTWVGSTATYGKEVALASEKALMLMTAKFGPEAAKHTQELSAALLGGDQKAANLATTLGVSMADLSSKNAETQAQALMQALENLKGMVGDTEGQADAAYWVHPLLSSLGATPGMLAMANLEPLTRSQFKESRAKSLEEAAQAAREADVMASLKESVASITVALIPAIEIVAKVLQGIAETAKFLKNQIAAFVVMWAARAMINKTSAAIGMMGGTGITKAHGVIGKSGKAIHGTGARNAIRAGTAKSTGSISMFQKMFIKFSGKFGKIFSKIGGKFIGKLLGFLAKGILRFLGPIGIILSFLPQILSWFGVGADSDEEAKKQREKTNALLDKPSKQEDHLLTIAQSLNQNNIYQEQLILQAEEQTQLAKDSNMSKPPAQLGPQFDIPPKGVTI